MANHGNSERRPKRRESGRSDSSPPPQVGDRLPPHSIEAEQGVLGCCLLDPKEALGLAMERFGAREVFYDLRHQALFSTLAEMVNGGRMVDLITVQAYLQETPERSTGNLLEGLGGMPYLAGLMNGVGSAAACEHYVEIVRERHRLRQMLRVLAESQRRIWEWDGEVGALINGIETDVLAAGEDSGSNQGAKPMREVFNRTVNLVEGCFHRGKGIIDGVATGFSYLDKMLGGLHNGEYTLIGARPSCGKTAMMMGIAKHVARVQKRKVGIFSVEMQDTALCLRLWCDMAEVNMQQVRTGFMSNQDMKRLTGIVPDVAKLGISFDDTGSLDIQTFRARARRMKREGVALILVDYIQLMSNPDLEGRERHLEVASISKGIKAACKELNLPIVVLAQLNRETAKDSSRRPRMDDLGESGQLERDADVIGLLYKPKHARTKEEKAESEEGFDEDGNAKGATVIPVNLLIAKQRNGPTGDCEFFFHKEFMRFEDKCAGQGSREGELQAMRNVTLVSVEGEARKGEEELGLGK